LLSEAFRNLAASNAPHSLPHLSLHIRIYVHDGQRHETPKACMHIDAMETDEDDEEEYEHRVDFDTITAAASRSFHLTTNALALSHCTK
jgi:hypothetical protein